MLGGVGEELWGSYGLIRGSGNRGRGNIGSRHYGRWFTLISKTSSITLAQRCASSEEAAYAHYQLPECRREGKLQFILRTPRLPNSVS